MHACFSIRASSEKIVALVTILAKSLPQLPPGAMWRRRVRTVSATSFTIAFFPQIVPHSRRSARRHLLFRRQRRRCSFINFIKELFPTYYRYCCEANEWVWQENVLQTPLVAQPAWTGSLRRKCSTCNTSALSTSSPPRAYFGASATKSRRCMREQDPVAKASIR